MVGGHADVHGKAAELSLIERRGDGVFVEQFAARHVDEQRSRFHRAEKLGVDEVPGLLGRRSEREHDVGLRNNVGHIAELDAGGRVDIGSVEGEYSQAHSDKQLREIGADKTEPDDGRCLASNLAARPLWRSDVTSVVVRRVRDMARQVEIQGERKLSGRRHVARVGSRDQYARLRGFVDIDRADIDRAPQERQQALVFREQLGFAGGGAMGHDHVAVAGVLEQLLGRQVVVGRVDHHVGDRLHLWKSFSVVGGQVLRVVGEKDSHRRRGYRRRHGAVPSGYEAI